MTKLQSAEQLWESYAEAIFQGMEPSEVQLVETKKAFYSGIWAILTTFTQIGEPDVPDMEAEKYLSQLHDDVWKFSCWVLAKHAEMN